MLDDAELGKRVVVLVPGIWANGLERVKTLSMEISTADARFAQISELRRNLNKSTLAGTHCHCQICDQDAKTTVFRHPLGERSADGESSEGSEGSVGALWDWIRLGEAKSPKDFEKPLAGFIYIHIYMNNIYIYTFVLYVLYVLFNHIVGMTPMPKI